MYIRTTHMRISYYPNKPVNFMLSFKWWSLTTRWHQSVNKLSYYILTRFLVVVACCPHILNLKLLIKNISWMIHIHVGEQSIMSINLFIIIYLNWSFILDPSPSFSRKPYQMSIMAIHPQRVQLYKQNWTRIDNYSVPHTDLLLTKMQMYMYIFL